MAICFTSTGITAGAGKTMMLVGAMNPTTKINGRAASTARGTRMLSAWGRLAVIEQPSWRAQIKGVAKAKVRTWAARPKIIGLEQWVSNRFIMLMGWIT